MTMCNSCQQDAEEKYAELKKVLTKYHNDPESLIVALHEAQLIFGYLPRDVQIHIAEALNVPISEVYGVVTFYSLFSTVPKGRNKITVCMGTACYVKGAGDILEALKENLKIDVGETTEDGVFTLESARCVGACSLAPVVMVNGEVHSEFTAQDIPELIRGYRAAQDPAEKRSDLH